MDSRIIQKTPKEPETETVEPIADSVSPARSVKKKTRLEGGSLKEIYDNNDEHLDKNLHNNKL